MIEEIRKKIAQFRPLVKIVTLHEPDPRRWIDFKMRRR